MELNLSKTKSVEIVTKEAQVATVNKVILAHITDSPNVKTVKAIIVVAGFPKELTLWSGDAYDKIGDWSQAQANARILELI